MASGVDVAGCELHLARWGSGRAGVLPYCPCPCLGGHLGPPSEEVVETVKVTLLVVGAPRGGKGQRSSSGGEWVPSQVVVEVHSRDS